VADFGCTQRAALASVTVETVRGALAYQAPEVLARRVLSPAADCYAFGVLLWEMLTAQARPGCRGSHARLSLNAAGARRSTQWHVGVEDCWCQRAQARSSSMLRCGRLLRCSQAAGSLVPGVCRDAPAPLKGACACGCLCLGWRRYCIPSSHLATRRPGARERAVPALACSWGARADTECD